MRRSSVIMPWYGAWQTALLALLIATGAVQAAPRYRVLELGLLEFHSTSNALDIKSCGEIADWSLDGVPDGERIGFLWRNGVMQAIKSPDSRRACLTPSRRPTTLHHTALRWQRTGPVHRAPPGRHDGRHIDRRKPARSGQYVQRHIDPGIACAREHMKAGSLSAQSPVGPSSSIRAKLLFCHY